MFDADPTLALIAVLFLGLLALAAFWDAHALRIPNRVSGAVALLYPAYVLAAAPGVDWIGGLIVAAIVFAIGTALFAAGTVGGGDVKLLAAAALWAGPSAILEFTLTAGVAGGVLAIVLGGRLRFALALAFDRVGNGAARDVALGGQVPYAIAIAFAGFAVIAPRLVVG